MACNKPFLRKIVRPYISYVKTPCGYCAGCRRDKINMWSDRLSFEANTCEGRSSFITLTYNDNFLPVGGVQKVDVQNWLKRLRFFLPKDRRIKYFVSSEYGLENYRPHYHVILINFDCQDVNDNLALYRSWSEYKGQEIGFYTSDYLTPARIRYTLKYMSKELKGDLQDEYVKRGLNPLFHLMSKGIGREWFFSNLDLLRIHHGYYVNGKLRPLPRYYAELLRCIDPLYDNKTLVEKSYKIIKHIFDQSGQKWSPYDLPTFSESLIQDLQKERTMIHEEYLKESANNRHYGMLVKL